MMFGRVVCFFLGHKERRAKKGEHFSPPAAKLLNATPLNQHFEQTLKHLRVCTRCPHARLTRKRKAKAS
jgi:hypothetical protein